MDKIRSFAWRPTTTVVLFGGFTLIIVALVASYILTNFKPTTSVLLGSGMYDLWLADDNASLEKGLSGVEELAINGGLLMDFQADNTWGIWMKDMKIPLDIIWLDNQKKVVYIEQNVSPDLGTSKTFVPKVASRYVLELPAGSVKKAGIKMSQFAQFNIERGKKS